MKKVILNNRLIAPDDIDLVVNKIRVVIKDKNGKLLMTKCSGFHFFPGIKVTSDDPKEDLIKCLNARFGIDLDKFNELATLYHYQLKHEEELNYNKRLVITDYYYAKVDELKITNADENCYMGYFDYSESIIEDIKDNNSNSTRKFSLEEETEFMLEYIEETMIFDK